MDRTAKKYELLDCSKRREIIEILKYNELNDVRSNLSEIGRLFNVSRFTIMRIRDSKENLEEKLEKYQNMPCLNKRKRIPQVKNHRLDEALFEWFKHRRAFGQPVTPHELQEKAMQINVSIQGDPEFKASKGWLAKFKDRYGLHFCSIQGVQSSVEYDDSVECVEKLTSIIRMRNFQLYQIYNADETGLRWRMLPPVDFISEYEKTGTKFSEDRVSLMVCANADGSHKLPLFVIGKSKDPRCMKDTQPLPVAYVSQENAWMTSEIFRKWYTDLFLPSVQQFQAVRGQSYKVLLILDNANCHLSKEEINAIDDSRSAEFLHFNITSSIQPMDQGVTERLKKLYRKSFLREMLFVEDKLSIIEFLKAREMKTFCTQIASAWAQITSENISQAWKKLIPDCDIDTTKDDTIPVQDYLEILYRIPGFKDVTAQGVSMWLKEDANDPGWEVFDIEQILLSMQSTSTGTDFIKIEEIKEEIASDEDMEYESFESEVENSVKEDVTNCSDAPIQDECEAALHHFKDTVKEDAPNCSNAQIPGECEAALHYFKDYRKWFEKRPECNPEHLIQLQQFYELTLDIVSQAKFVNVTRKISSLNDE